MANNEEPSSEGSLQESYYIRVINCIASAVGVGKGREKEFGSVTAREREEKKGTSLLPRAPEIHFRFPFERLPRSYHLYYSIPQCSQLMKFYTDLRINPCILIKEGSPRKLKRSLFFLSTDTISSIKFNELWSVVIDFFRIA